MTKSITDIIKVNHNGDRSIDALDLVATKEVKEWIERYNAMKDTDKELIDLLDMKFLDPRLFWLLAKKLESHYDIYAGRLPYPEDDILDVIKKLDSAAYFLETFDWEQHVKDKRNDYQEKE